MAGPDPPGAEQDTPMAVVGRRASRDFWVGRADETCASALDRLRARPTGAVPAPLHYCYIVDQSQRLVGCASVVAVLGAPPERPLGEVMSPRVVPIPEGAPEEAIQDFFITYGLLSFPVVDREGRLSGVVGVEHFSDLVFEGFDGQVREEAYRSVGLQARELEQTSPVAAARLRLPWLLVTVAGGFVAALLLGQATLDLTQLAVVALFLPLGIMLAERVTSRTLTIRAAWPPGERGLSSLPGREVGAAFLLSLVLAPLCGGLVYLWHGHAGAALLVAAAVFAIVLVAVAVGLLVPVAERGARGSRAIVPIALAVADVAAVAIYLVLARLMPALH